MQLNIFAKADPLLKEQNFNIDVDKFVKSMGYYHHNDWIYPSAIHRKLKIDIKVVYFILELLTKENYMESYLQIICPNCRRYAGFSYKNIGNIPEVVSCLNCDFEVEIPLNHAVIVYKVL